MYEGCLMPRGEALTEQISELGSDLMGHGRHSLLSQNDSAFSRCLHGHCCVSAMSSSTASLSLEGCMSQPPPHPRALPFSFENK